MSFGACIHGWCMFMLRPNRPREGVYPGGERQKRCLCGWPSGEFWGAKPYSFWWVRTPNNQPWGQGLSSVQGTIIGLRSHWPFGKQAPTNCVIRFRIGSGAGVLLRRQSIRRWNNFDQLWSTWFWDATSVSWKGGDSEVPLCVGDWQSVLVTCHHGHRRKPNWNILDDQFSLTLTMAFDTIIWTWRDRPSGLCQETSLLGGALAQWAPRSISSSSSPDV